LLGPVGLVLAALTLGVYISRCDTLRIFPLLVTGYVVGVILIGWALIVRFKPGVAMSILVVLGVATIALGAAAMGFLASFARCWEL
jgi:hypothetical protein